jgi:nucleoside-diphosphate-sugar epimerase
MGKDKLGKEKMNKDKKILIIGGAGYIGSVITNRAINERYKVKVLDLLWFNKKVPLVYITNPCYTFIKGDAYSDNVLDTALDDIDYVIYTAAVVGDPASIKYPELTKRINIDTAKKVIDKCQGHGIKGFIFFSTCSNYGISNDGLATEETLLNPLSLYAETKVAIERYLSDNNNNLDWIIGRLSTVYGLSSRMRFDLTVNEFALKGYKDEYIDIFNPESYRPYIHTYDLANIIVELVNKFEQTKNNIFNIGFNGENYQKIQIAQAVQKFIPELKIDIIKSGGDMRDYQVDFSKLSKYVNVKRVFNVEKSVENIISTIKMGLFENTSSNQYYNTKPDLSEV